MRLDPQQIDLFKQLTHDIFGPQARIRLFGSRLDEQRHGGDIDLYISHYQQTLDELPWAMARFVALAQQQLGEQRIDILPAPAAGLPAQAIHRIAEQSGVLL
ncbi:MAG: nucleotidyltransferase domain-containing protein [Magnetococcales bacterium]|nr:nucleotidyltransferase domain-containing protein [Magnetococcales bacterium]MBF0114444.1 nucleotidyltransferase domain-containing protein [Magnetococcales bacterium]